MDGHLHDAVDVVFDRFLGRQQLVLDGVEAPQGGIERGRLAGTGRAGHDDDAVGLVDVLAEVLVDVVGHADVLQVQGDGGAVEHAQHDAFAELGREGGHAEVDHAAGDGQLDAAVLGHAPFGDVEARDHLEARRDRQGEMARRRGHFVEGAVHAVADLEFVLEGLEVDVAGPVLHGLVDHEIDEAHHGARIGGGLHRGDVVGAGAAFEQVAGVRELALQAGEHVLHGLVFGAVIAGNGVGDFAGRGDHELDVLRQHEADFVARFGPDEIGDGQRDGRGVDGDGHHVVHARDAAGHGLEGFGGHAHVLEIHPLRAQQLRDQVQPLLFGDEPHFLGDVLGRLAGAFVLVDDLGGLAVVDQAVADQLLQKHVGIFGHGGILSMVACRGFAA